jgi:drug/metabolite transporter (DMT)-like permease
VGNRVCRHLCLSRVVFLCAEGRACGCASLIAYLWPLLIVLLSSVATGESLRKRQLLGALLGLAGTAFIMQLRARSDGASMPVIGYAAALPVLGSGRSIRSSTGVSAMFRAASSVSCGLAVAGWLCHLAFETTVRPDTGQWAAIIALGWARSVWLFWDHATKHGNLATLGALSYLAPLFSRCC